MNKKYITWAQAKDAAYEACKNFCYKNRGWIPVIYGVPRGGIPAMFLVRDELLYRYSISSVVIDDPTKADIIVDDIVDSGETERRMKESTRKLFLFHFLRKEKSGWCSLGKRKTKRKGRWIIFVGSWNILEKILIGKD